MKILLKRIISLAVCAVMLVGMVISVLPPLATVANAASNKHYTDYSTVALVPNQGDCPSMQACAADGNYIYCSKINTSTETSAVIGRIHKDTGAVTWLTNSATGTKFFSQLGHANDLFVADVGDVKTMFVATGSFGAGEYSIVRFVLSGTTLTQVGHYRATYNGSNIGLASADVMSVSDTEIKLICKRNNIVYTGTIGVNQTSGEVPLTQLCTLNLTDVTINGSSKDISGFVTQGFEYIDNKVFVPMTGDSANINTSCIVCYDLEGASGSIKNDPTFSTWIVSSTYADLFEIENCAISPSDGLMYFSTNRRKTSSDANHDGIHILTGFVYDPAAGDSTKPGDYRWEMIDDKLTPVTTGGAIYNGTTQRLGSVSKGTISSGQYSLDQAVVLNHDQPWVLEWKSSSWTSNSLFLSTYSISGYEGNYFIFRRNNSDLIAIGERKGGQYDNYGLKLSDYGVDGSKTHVYRMENRIASNGTNMVYLIVDGKELGALNQYYIGADAQGKTSNWISGKDFAFSYMGTPQHKLGCTLEYIQVWGRGILSEVDEPDTFRWETKSNAMTNISEFGLTPNAVTKLGGSCKNGVYSGSYYSIDEEIVLLHDRPWSVEWQAEGSGTSRFISTSGSSRATPYILKSNVVALGHYDGTQYNNYGLSLRDFGIDSSAAHVYRMTNRIAADGSNMVYLYVDGVELGAMNNLYYGGTFQRSNANWISGKDFTFGYLGTFQHPYTDFSVGYIQVWEAGIPGEDVPNNYRWEPQSNKINNITTNGFTANALTTLEGSIVNGIFDDAYYRLEKSIVLAHDSPWSIEWQSEGDWKDSSNGAMLLAASNTVNAPNAPYLYRRNASTFIAFGERRDGNHQNYGVSLSGHGIDGTVPHVYRLTNRIAANGSNMVYLFVDGKEIGPMNEYFVGGTAQGTTSNWVSGKDFVFSYMGNVQFPIGNCSMDYFQVMEGHTHSFGNWITTNVTCTTDGVKTRTCSVCGEVETEKVSATGHKWNDATCTTAKTCSVCGETEGKALGHNYKGVVKAPTCTKSGYTTYTCSGCGDSYIGNVTPATGHDWNNGACQDCGTVCDHVLVDGYCSVCGMKLVKDYYLFGYINGSDYACEGDADNIGEYRFVNGKLTATFTENSYVAVKTEDNANWYMTNGWVGEDATSATLYNTNITGEYSNKLFVPGGVEVTFTLVENADGTLTLSYDAAKPPVVEDSKDIKWQVTRGTNANSATTNLRLLTWVDSLENYSAVTFNVTINGKTTQLKSTTAYTAILASGVAIYNPANIFKNDSANYFVSYTLKNIPSSAFDTPIVVTVTWTDLQGNETTSESKTVVISNDWA